MISWKRRLISCHFLQWPRDSPPIEDVRMMHQIPNTYMVRNFLRAHIFVSWIGVGWRKPRLGSGLSWPLWEPKREDRFKHVGQYHINYILLKSCLFVCFLTEEAWAWSNGGLWTRELGQTPIRIWFVVTTVGAEEGRQVQTRWTISYQLHSKS